jgi:hypothetical protein
MGEAVDQQALSDLATPWFLRVAVTLHLPELINDGVDDVEGLATGLAQRRMGCGLCSPTSASAASSPESSLIASR